jgi:hypothetical protein
MDLLIQRGDVMKKPEIMELKAGSKYQITSLGSKEAPILEVKRHQ